MLMAGSRMSPTKILKTGQVDTTGGAVVLQGRSNRVRLFHLRILESASEEMRKKILYSKSPG